jgi:hypothetical protein
MTIHRYSKLSHISSKLFKLFLMEFLISRSNSWDKNYYRFCNKIYRKFYHILSFYIQREYSLFFCIYHKLDPHLVHLLILIVKFQNLLKENFDLKKILLDLLLNYHIYLRKNHSIHLIFALWFVFFVKIKEEIY